MLAVRHKRADMDCCEEHIVHMDAVETARRQMPDDDITTAASDFFKAFSDKTRLRILTALVSAELCVAIFAHTARHEPVGNFPSAAFFETGPSCKEQKNGKTVYYALCDDHIQTILAQGIAHVQEG